MVEEEHFKEIRERERNFYASYKYCEENNKLSVVLS